MSLSQLEQENKFKKHLGEYWASKGITQIKIPQIGGQQLNLFKLYKTVCKKGGGQSVSHNKLWKEIVDEFGLPSTCTSASFTLKNHYQKYLLGYEQRFYFGKDDSADLPQLVAGRQRKPLKSEGFQMSHMNNRFNNRMDMEMNHTSLSSQLKKFYEKTDHSNYVNYIKRTKIYPVMAEVKHMMMAFQSKEREEIIYAINMLTLFSVNTEAPLLFSQYPYVIESIHIYLSSNYPPKDVFDLECFRNLTLSLRNLLINTKNLQPVLESDLLQILFKIFEDHIDRQLTRNVIDCFSSLTRVGLDFKELINVVQYYLDKESYEDIQTGIDLLRSLLDQKQCEDIITQRMDYFSRLLLYNSIQIRQAVLEIFGYLTDKFDQSKQICLFNFKFMDRLFALLSHGYGATQKQAQLSCFILNNIFQLHTNESLNLFKKYEKTLMSVSFNDQSLSPITSVMLFSLSGRVNEFEDFDKDKQNFAIANMRINIQRSEIDSNSSEQNSEFE